LPIHAGRLQNFRKGVAEGGNSLANELNADSPLLCILELNLKTGVHLASGATFIQE
jgi:hypothetical protein